MAQENHQTKIRSLQGHKFAELLNKSRISIDSLDNSILSQEIVREILQNLKSTYHHYILFKLALVTGLKAQEIVNLKTKHIIHETESIYVPYSDLIANSEERYIGLSREFYLELIRFTQASSQEEYIFPGRNGCMSWRSVSYTLHKVHQITKRNLGMKDFQNSFIISLIRNGANLQEMAYFLGHRSTTSIRRRFRRLYQAENSRYELISSIFLKSA